MGFVKFFLPTKALQFLKFYRHFTGDYQDTTVSLGNLNCLDDFGQDFSRLLLIREVKIFNTN